MATSPSPRPAAAPNQPRELLFWLAAGVVLLLLPLLLVMALHGVNTEIERVDKERVSTLNDTGNLREIHRALVMPPGDPRFAPVLEGMKAGMLAQPDLLQQWRLLHTETPEARRGTLILMGEMQAARLQGNLERGAREAAIINRRVTIAFVLIFMAIIAAGALAVRYTRLRTRLLARVRTDAARSQAIFDSAMDGILTLSPRETIESINRAGEIMFGYDDGELIGQDAAVLMPPAPGVHATFLERARAARDLSKSQVCELEARRKDGSVFQVDMNLGEMRQRDGVHLVAILRDGTERKRTEKAKSEFVSTVSHELRTPLTSIAGSLGLLLGGAAGPITDKASRLVKIAESNSQRLVRLINDILDIEKIASGQVTFNLRALDLSELTRRALDNMGGFASEFGVTFELEVRDRDVRVQGDADRLTQVMANLLSNAAKFSPRGGKVKTLVSIEDGKAHFCVADHGTGIPVAFRDRIFGKFAQADSSDTRQKGGTGLGLAISKEIVERHGGRIWFDSVPMQGSTFHVELPLYRPARAAMLTSDREMLDLPLVLHVDDDPDLRQLVREALMGVCRVQEAESLESARLRLLEETPRLAILDLGLPDGSGLDLLPALVDAEGRALPVVVFTVHSVEPTALTKGVDAILTKSRASLEQLGSTVGKLLDSQKTI